MYDTIDRGQQKLGGKKMKTLTIKNVPIGERLMSRREQYFSGIETMTDEQANAVSYRWHAISNRYQIWVKKCLVRKLGLIEN